MHFRSFWVIVAAVLFSSGWTTGLCAAEPANRLRVGIIGCDAHALPWTQIINGPKATGEVAEMRIVAAYPGGSADIPQSMESLKTRIPLLKALGVEIVDSIDALLAKVDVVMLLSIDGRKHLEEARPVFAAGKRVFIDKPLGGSLVEAIKIINLAQACQVPCFSSSALRYGKELVEIRNSPNIGDIRGCDTYSPAPLEPHHPDFYWYGIHGVEPLFALLGTGCRSVTRVHTEGSDVIVGVWEGGRIGGVRGLRDAARGYGATVFGSKGTAATNKFGGYEPLIVEIVKFFKTGKPPVSAQETLEIMAFMEAADESKRHGGVPVTIQSVMAKATTATVGK